MLYDGNNPILQIVGVEHMCWSRDQCDCFQATVQKAFWFHSERMKELRQINLALYSINHLALQILTA